MTLMLYASGRLAEVQDKLSKLEENHSIVKREGSEEIHKLKVELETSTSQISRVTKEIEITRNENSKLTDFIKEQER